jgi:hypothetical protein
MKLNDQLAIINHSLNYQHQLITLLLTESTAALAGNTNNNKKKKKKSVGDVKMLIGWATVPRHNPPKFQPLILPNSSKNGKKTKKKNQHRWNERCNRYSNAYASIMDDSVDDGDVVMDIENEKKHEDGTNRKTTKTTPVATVVQDEHEELSTPVSGTTTPTFNTTTSSSHPNIIAGTTTSVAMCINDTWDIFGGYGYDAEAGDWPIQQVSAATINNMEDTMDVARLLVRLYSCQSDLLARKARVLSQQKDWVDGVINIQQSIKSLDEALNLADNEISKHEQKTYSACLAAAVGGSHSGSNHAILTAMISYSKQRLWNFQHDADAIHVASMSVIKTNDMYNKAAKKQKDRLEKGIKESLEARERVKSAMGEERWNNNYKNKKVTAWSLHYAQRQAKAQELKSVNTALDKLSKLDDISTMEESILSLKERTVAQYNSTYFSMLPGFSQQQQDQQAQALSDFYHSGLVEYTNNTGTVIDRSRYNNLRPSVAAATYRLLNFPDASEYGWLYTGCDETQGVEYFEKQYVQEEKDADGIPGNIALPTVKLDWYYMTGDCSVVMCHPINGTTYLFTSNGGISPELYIQVLEDPRNHQRLRVLYHHERQDLWKQQQVYCVKIKGTKKKNKNKNKRSKNKIVGMNGWK